ncbi:hypothetical protein ASE74_12860 [Pedobacter sp. Leaf216]|uniref:hypothetical protein n=1 Tax=Pedobacter sp. Leaf216 TaxID=1735684 RepID=UPI0006FF3DA9|nr:hypothetical protein [Pedobacter sp. Leaf216]KQM78844.1 hypothetical protein ASE74_12860 [Pedobacter sp. Leaf216]
MVLNIIKLSFVVLLLVSTLSCTTKPKKTKNVAFTKKVIDNCRYSAYDAHQIVSNLGCWNCHLRILPEQKDERGWATFNDLAKMDSLKLVTYTFEKNHKGWFSKTGPYNDAKMDTLSDCQIKSVIRYIKDTGRDIPMSSQ